MRKLLFALGILIPVSCMMSSCRSCVKKAAEKTTELALSAVDGVAEVLNEQGEETGKKVTDAIGKIAKGSLSSIGELLDEHADTVAQSAGRTLVQTLEGLDKGITDNYYTQIPFISDFPGGVTLDYFSKIDNKSVVDAYFIITEEGVYDIDFEYTDTAGNVLFRHNATVTRSAGEENRYTVVSYALNPEELQLFGNVAVAAIRIKK